MDPSLLQVGSSTAPGRPRKAPSAASSRLSSTRSGRGSASRWERRQSQPVMAAATGRRRPTAASSTTATPASPGRPGPSASTSRWWAWPGARGPPPARRRRCNVTGVRLLVAEDQPRLAALLEKGLEEEGYAVDLAADGELAHWLAMENEYDVIVLDVMLPGMDGFSLCRQLRDAGRAAPVIMLTARDAVTDRGRGLDAGADDYLVKPFSFSE